MYPHNTATAHSVVHVEEEAEIEEEGALDKGADLGLHLQTTLQGIIHNKLHRRTVVEQWQQVY